MADCVVTFASSTLTAVVRCEATSAVRGVDISLTGSD